MNKKKRKEKQSCDQNNPARHLYNLGVLTSIELQVLFIESFWHCIVLEDKQFLSTLDMAILENSGDYDLMQLWAIITELGEQLSQNRSMSVSLGGLGGKIKVFIVTYSYEY